MPGSASASDTAALAALLDRTAIIELVHAYCNAADRKDNAKMRALYHEDATDNHGGFFQGLAMDFIDQLPEIQAPMEILHHNITTVNVALDGDYAEGEVYVLAFHRVSRVEDGPVDLLIGGRYLDQYEKRAGCWKFAHRSVVADWVNVHDPSIVELEHPLVQGSLIGRSSADDPAYDVFRLLRRGHDPRTRWRR